LKWPGIKALGGARGEIGARLGTHKKVRTRGGGGEGACKGFVPF